MWCGSTCGTVQQGLEELNGVCIGLPSVWRCDNNKMLIRVLAGTVTFSITPHLCQATQINQARVNEQENSTNKQSWQKEKHAARKHYRTATNVSHDELAVSPLPSVVWSACYRHILLYSRTLIFRCLYDTTNMYFPKYSGRIGHI